MPLVQAIGATGFKPTGIPVVQNGLLVYLDAANPASYSISGSGWNDLSGNGFNSNVFSSQTYSADGGGSISFNGSTQYATGSGNPSLDTTGNMTVSVWFKVTATAADWVRIIGKGDGNAGTRTYGLWYNTVAGNFLYQRYGATNMDALYAAPVNLNTWYNMVGVSSGTTHTLYLNNTSVATGSVGSTFSSSTMGYTLGFSGTIHTYHNGLISQACIYNRALSSPELSANFNAVRGRYGV